MSPKQIFPQENSPQCFKVYLESTRDSSNDFIEWVTVNGQKYLAILDSRVDVSLVRTDLVKQVDILPQRYTAIRGISSLWLR